MKSNGKAKVQKSVARSRRKVSMLARRSFQKASRFPPCAVCEPRRRCHPRNRRRINQNIGGPPRSTAPGGGSVAQAAAGQFQKDIFEGGLAHIETLQPLAALAGEPQQR